MATNRTFFDHPAFDRPASQRAANGEAGGEGRAQRLTGGKRLVDLLLYVHQGTDRAWLVSLTGHSDSGVWLPKAEVEVERRAGERELADITIPEWLAIERRLV